MKNVTMEVKDNKLVIEIDLSKEYGLSSSGKTTIVASSEGNQSVPNFPEIKFGVNVYKK